MGIELVHFIVTVIWGAICLMMGIILAVFHIPENETLKTYRSSVRILAVNYLFLAVFVFCLEFFNLRNSPDDIFPFPILFISISEGIIFPFTLIALYLPVKATKQNVLKYNILPFAILLTGYFLSSAFFGDPVCNTFHDFFSQIDSHPTLVIRFLLLLFNIYQIIYYSAKINRLSTWYIRRLNNFYSDTIQFSPRWAVGIFAFAVSIGMFSIISTFIKNIFFDTVATLIFSVFYFLFALLYMLYKNVFIKLKCEMENESDSSDTSVIGLNYDDNRRSSFDWQTVRSRIIEERLFLKTGITINDMVDYFGTNRTTFSTSLNKNESKNFNTFINHLRIEHAQHVILNQPELTISEIAQICGYTEQSNFTKHFKQFSKETPAIWAKKQKVDY